MPAVAVINRKGGSGKSTLATQLAGSLANRGLQVMLGDVDRQQSSLAWLRRRAAQPLAKAPRSSAGPSAPRASCARPPASRTWCSTPRAACTATTWRASSMSADAILMPVGDSIFDRESALECHAELMTLPRVASGRCKVGHRRHAAGRPHQGRRAHPGLGPARPALRRLGARIAAVPARRRQGLTVFDCRPPRSRPTWRSGNPSWTGSRPRGPPPRRWRPRPRRPCRSPPRRSRSSRSDARSCARPCPSRSRRWPSTRHCATPCAWARPSASAG